MGGALYYAVDMYSDMLFGGSIAQWGGMVVLLVGGAVLFAILAVLFGAAKLIDTRRLLKR